MIPAGERNTDLNVYVANELLTTLRITPGFPYYRPAGDACVIEFQVCIASDGSQIKRY